MKFKSSIGKIIKLSPERRKHIIETHPIMEDYLKYLKEILGNPDEIRYSSRTDNVLLFYRFFDNIENGKYITAVVNILEYSVKTAYLANRIKTGRIYEKIKKF